MERKQLEDLLTRIESLEGVMRGRVFDDAGKAEHHVDAGNASCWVATVNLKIELDRELCNHDE